MSTTIYLHPTASSLSIVKSEDETIDGRIITFRDAAGNTLLEVITFVSPTFQLQTKLPITPSAPLLCGTTASKAT